MNPLRWAYTPTLKLLFKLPPEQAHSLIMSALGVLQNVSFLQKIVSSLFEVKHPQLGQTLHGVYFPRPLGLAAGFDKNATRADVWQPCGFGYAEVGTITALPQPGNPQPRLFRLPADKALLNRMGFNNHGFRAAAQTLSTRKTDRVIGVNLGKSKRTAVEKAAVDYASSAQGLEEYADYLVINVSSPNTPGLRDLQAVASLEPIITAVQEVSQKPLFVKLAPDLSDEDIVNIAKLAIRTNLAGLIATNTTISRAGLKTPPEEVEAMGPGGISGPPENARSLEVLKLLHSVVPSDMTLVSVGGIFTPQQAWERITAGAHLLQGYTGMIYGGPLWIKDIHNGILAQLKAYGLNSISEAIGTGLEWKD